MANAVQAVFAIAGGAIGSIWGPSGAAYGFQIGLQIGRMVSPTQLPPVVGPRLEDLRTTTAQLGDPIIITYGTIAVPGTVIWLGFPREESNTETVGGKGGGDEQKVTTYTYFQSIALGLCEGIIGGILRIWENGVVVYDKREQQDYETAEQYIARVTAANEYEATFTLYLGTEDQEPDPTIEAMYGDENVPGYRGLAYIVYPDRQLLDTQARRHPNFRFEVYHEGTSERQVYLPTNIAANSAGEPDGVQRDILAVDWLRDRYYVWDLTGDNDEMFIRGFSILSPKNTEFISRSFTDIGIDNIIESGYHMTVGDDGFLYAVVPTDNDYLTINKLDPLTLDLLATATQTISGNLFRYMQPITVVREAAGSAPERTEYFLIGTTFFRDCVAYNCDGLTQVLSFDRTSTAYRGHVCRGPTQDGVSYAYVLFYDISSTSSSGPAEVIRVSFAIGPPDPVSGEPAVSVAYETVATFLPDDFYAVSPSYSKMVSMDSLHFDPVDDCIFFYTTLGLPMLGGPSVDLAVKYDPDTNTFPWVTELPAGYGGETYDNNSNLSVNTRSRAIITESLGEDTRFINLETGEIEDAINWTQEVIDAGGDGATAFNGQQVYNASLGAMIAMLGDEANTLFLFGGGPSDCVTLAEIVDDVCNRCGLTDDQIDVSDLDICIHGYAITRPMPGRNAIEPLRPIGPFDSVESGIQLKFPTRGKAIVATLANEDMGAHVAGGSAPAAVTTKKAQDVDLPRSIRLKYISQFRDYEPAEQISPVRFDTDAVNDVDVEIPVAFLTDSQAAQTTEIIWADAWASRWSHQVVVDQSYAHLEPADAIAIPVDGDIQRVRIASIDETIPMLRKLDCLRDDDGNFESYAIGTGPKISPTTLSLLSQSELLLLDLPTLRDEDDNAGIYAAAYPSDAGYNWGGVVIFRSADDGGTYANVGSITRAATVGTLNTDLASGISTTWDLENEIIVDMAWGSFESVEDEQFLFNGRNAVAIGADGRWEIVQFQNAEQISANQWSLTKLLRGRRATEHNIGTGVAGDTVVLLSNGALVRIPVQTTEISQARVFRAVTINKPFSSGIDQDFTPEGEALEPFSPVQIEGERDVDGNLTITWTRRGRIGQELPGDADIPLSEETESYEVDIIESGSPGDAARTIAATTTTCTYTAAQQMSDFGFMQASVLVRVYQLSATVGRGTAGEATI